MNGLVFPSLGPPSLLASSMQASPSRGPGSAGAPAESNGLSLGGMEPHGNIKLLALSRQNDDVCRERLAQAQMCSLSGAQRYQVME